MGDRKLKLPKLRVRDLQFNYGTVLIATLNGKAIPPTGKFEATGGSHAEQHLDRAVRQNWLAMRQEGENQLVARITRSPCSMCTNVCEQLKSDIPELNVDLRMMSDFGGKAKFHRNVKLFKRLQKAGIELSAWNVLDELDEIGLQRERLPDDQIAEIERRSKQVKAVIDTAKK